MKKWFVRTLVRVGWSLDALAIKLDSPEAFKKADSLAKTGAAQYRFSDDCCGEDGCCDGDDMDAWLYDASMDEGAE